MRQSPVNILKYMPDFLFAEFKAAADSCSQEHEKLRLLLQDIFKQFFVVTATWGLAYYEDILAIKPNKFDSYEQRRDRILLRYQTHQTSTVKFMQGLVNRYIVDKSAQIVEHNDQYYFDVLFNKDSCFDMRGLIEALELFKPAHLGYKRYEIQHLEQNIFVGGSVGLSEVTEIPADTTYSIEPITAEITFGAVVKIEEITVVGSE